MIYKEKILESIVSDFFDTNVIKDGDTLIVALSGGMDSMCLIDSFIKLQSEVDYKLIALHVNHGIRGKEADRDSDFVKKYCRSFDIKLILEKVDAVSFSKNKKMTLEEAARFLRYEVINNYWKKFETKNTKHNTYVIVAHHEKDQVETVIHNIIRGTGLKGIAGMKKVNGYILRPLLDIKKEIIEKYVDDYDIPYVNDSTNDDLNYTRNFIRKEIIDKFESINSAACEHISNLSSQIRMVNDFLENESKKSYKDILVDEKKDKLVLDLKKFNSKEDIIKTGIIREVFEKLVNTLKDITNINYNDILELANKTKGGHLDLPYNITLDKKQNELVFIKNKKNVSMSRRKKK